MVGLGCYAGAHEQAAPHLPPADATMVYVRATIVRDSGDFLSEALHQGVAGLARGAELAWEGQRDEVGGAASSCSQA